MKLPVHAGGASGQRRGRSFLCLLEPGIVLQQLPILGM